MNEENLKVLIGSSKDNIEDAITALNTFCKNWCINCKESYRQIDLVFNCHKCEFEAGNKDCLIKIFMKNRINERFSQK